MATYDYSNDDGLTFEEAFDFDASAREYMGWRDNQAQTDSGELIGTYNSGTDSMQADQITLSDGTTFGAEDMRELKDRLNQRTNDTRLTTTGMRVDGQLAGKSADLAARLARLNGGTGGTRSSGGGGSGSGYDKFYNEFFKADEKAGLPSNDMDGFSVFKRYMSQAAARDPNANQDILASNAIRQITNAREMATGPNGLDVKKYRQLLDALGREKNPTLQDDPTINDANVIDSALRESGSSSEQVSTTAGKSAAGKDSGSGLLGLSVGSKPTDDIYANAGPDNSRLAALPGVPFAKLLDILRGRENYKALGKPFESYEDATLDWISRGEKQ